eukprot:Hpha_TRINITY_DN30314_c0_g1::TRINITY_DN30314_c0_g1_i1::g.147035::m.147035
MPNPRLLLLLSAVGVPPVPPAAHRCVPSAESFVVQERGLIDPSSCANKNDGDPCMPSCVGGYHAEGTPGILNCPNFDGTNTSIVLTNFTCVPYNCSNGPDLSFVASFVQEELDDIRSSVADCSALSSGMQCVPQCPPGFSSQHFEINCRSDSRFAMTQSVCQPKLCSGGPLPGTAAPRANFTFCNSLRSGQECSPECDEGYSNQGSIILVCDRRGWFTSSFNASAARCEANPCNDGPYYGRDARMDYADCISRTTGDTCHPTCPAGYHASMGISLVCRRLTAGNVTVWMFDSTGAECIPNDCRGGALIPNVERSECDSFRTGETCLAADVSCKNGYRSTGSQTLLCDDKGRYARVADGLECVEMWHTWWRQGVYEVVGRCSCDLLNREGGLVPWQLAPLQFSIGSHATGAVMGTTGLAFLFATACFFAPPKWRPALAGLLGYVGCHMLAPGLAMTSSSIILSTHKANVGEVVVAWVGALFCFVPFIVLSTAVLRRGEFHARYCTVANNSLRMRRSAFRFVL